jgi:hypothetical protein
VTLQGIVPKTGSFAFYQKKALQVKQADLRDIFKKAFFKSVCTSTIAVFLDSLSPSATSSAIKITGGAEEDPIGPESADK